MSGAISKLLRLMVQGNKEAVVTRVNVTDTPTLFETQLTGSQGRRRLNVYNNKGANSGEVGYGFSPTMVFNEAMIIPRGERSTWIPVSEDVDVYFMCEVSGETNLDIRVEEIA